MTPHPCMTDFLQAYKANPEIKGWYNGDHILHSGCLEFESTIDFKRFIPIESYGYVHLCSSFNHMTEWEKEILKDYFKRYEQFYFN